ncbi:MAG: serine/threonine-protein kinase [Gemmatimonadales bacterium]
MTIPEPLQRALAGRYDLERLIGQGGMATVYLARDVKHGRQVAVKVLRSDLAATIGVERFLREIQIAARLQHPHILLLIDSGEAEGFLYYVMPFVDGESLRSRIDRRGTLATEEVLALARQVADALDYAHRHGVVHRDIKPENILLSDGHAIVADFGVAKALSDATDRSITRTGYPVGTVGYMSPEQAGGFADLNERSDVFSLTCVIYEMLIGQVPGLWPSDEAIRLRRFFDAPADHRARLDRLPGSVEQVLVRGLGLRAEQRFESPRALVEALAIAMGEKPRYSETQAKEIVHRAAVLEATTPTLTGGLSLGGIQQLAADVGIPPEHVARAARELAPRRTGASAVRPNRWLGAPYRIVVERVTEAEASVDDYATLVNEVQMTVGTVGHASTLGRSLSWRTILGATPSGGGRNVSLTVMPAEGRARIRIEETLANPAGGLFGGLVGGMGGSGVALGIGLGLGALGSPLAAVLIGLGVVGASFGLARLIYARIYRGRLEELTDLAERLAGFVEDADRGRHRRIRS